MPLVIIFIQNQNSTEAASSLFSASMAKLIIDLQLVNAWRSLVSWTKRKVSLLLLQLPSMRLKQVCKASPVLLIFWSMTKELNQASLDSSNVIVVLQSHSVFLLELPPILSGGLARLSPVVACSIVSRDRNLHSVTFCHCIVSLYCTLHYLYFSTVLYCVHYITYYYVL